MLSTDSCFEHSLAIVQHSLKKVHLNHFIMKLEILFVISIMLFSPGSHTAGEEADETRTGIPAGNENQAQIINDSGPVAEQSSYFPETQQGMSGRERQDVQLLSATSDDISPPNQLSEGSLTGVTYVHWGKTTCPDQSPLVYAGVVGGKHFNDKGSGTNYLCLHSNPTYNRPREGRSTLARILGTEFEENFDGIPGLTPESEVACSVCLASHKRDVLMIPGTNSCPEAQGWTEEYHGYLVSARYNHYATQFICLDHEAEGLPRTGHDNDPSLLYVVEGICNGNGGGLPCPPYIDGYEITCVVCSL